jgi:MFS family permease
LALFAQRHKSKVDEAQGDISQKAPAREPGTVNNERKKPGIYYGWVIVGVIMLAGFTQSAGTFNVLGVFMSPITDEFSWNRSTFAGAIGIGSILGGLISPLIGPLVDRYGSRWALVISFAIMGLAFVLMAWMTTLWQFYALQVIGRMLNIGVVAVATSVIIPKWFVERRGRAVSTGMIGVWLGATITPLYVQALISQWSWRVGAAAVGLSLWVVSMAPAALFLRRQPEDMGLLPDGRSPEEESDGSPGSRPPPPDEISITLNQARRTQAFYLLTLAMSTGWFVRTGVILHLISFLIDRGLSPSTAAMVMSLNAASSIAGTIVFGQLVDRFSIRKVMAANFVVLAIIVYWMNSVDAIPIALAWAVVWGVTQGGFTSMQQIIYANYFGRRYLGSIQGTARGIQTIAQASGPLAAAAVFDASGGYFGIIVAYSVALMISAVAVFLSRKPQPLNQETA